MPFFSIITVCKNPGKSLVLTLESLRAQRFKDFEYIIVDGCSTDGTVALLNASYSTLINRLVSEDDDGIYDAMNKGISLSSGEYLYFLNAGDLFYDEFVLEKTFCFLSKHRHLEISYGRALIVDENYNPTVLHKYEYNDAIPFIDQTINHQAIFAAREVFHEFGAFDVKYRIFGDFDWYLRNFKREAGLIRWMPHTICKYVNNGISAMQMKTIGLSERNQILNKYFNRKAIVFFRFLKKNRMIWVFRIPFVRKYFDRFLNMRDGF